jgi:hypothetical protein
MEKTHFVFASGVVGGVSLGAAAGYFLTKRYLELEFEKTLAREVEQTKLFYSKLHKTEEFSTPEGAVEALIPVDKRKELVVLDQLRTYQGQTPPNTLQEKRAASVELRNIFKRGPIELTEEDLEIEKQDPGYPYVISSDEFTANDNNFDQVQLTFYAGDGILADERDETVEMVPKLVGENFHTKFGQKAGEDNVVYIRNEAIQTEFEIVRDERKYSEHVAGQTEE